MRSIREVEWEIPIESAAGWHVILGDNGSGKSTFVRATALGLVGPTEAVALRQNWDDWLKKGRSHASINLSLDNDSKFDKFSGRGAIPTDYYLHTSLRFTRSKDGAVTLTKGDMSYNPERYTWGGKSGWFSASYGPFRRFSGGDKDYEKMFYSNLRLAPHLTAFGESVALTEIIQWLQDLKFQELEKAGSGSLLSSLIKFINQNGFLPHDTQIVGVSSKGVDFVDGNRTRVQIDELSDGYRSILSLTLELIRQLVMAYPTQHVFSADDSEIIMPGVVMIDEVDAHLHPSWQSAIGLWFRKHFPRLQFIVTTHSPLVCQAANIGTVFRLPTPGIEEVAKMIRGSDLDRLLYGNLLDAYSTDLFGTFNTRSDQAKAMLARLAALNVAELDRDLTSNEREELERLRSFELTAMFPQGTPQYHRAMFTIGVLLLNEKDLLPVVRAAAYKGYKDRLKHYIRKKHDRAPSAVLDRIATAISTMGHPTVWKEMQRQNRSRRDLRIFFALAPEALNW